MPITKKILKWRKGQKPEAIMKRATFERIAEKAKEKYGIGEERAKKVAGKAYWTTVKAKAKKSAYKRFLKRT